MKLRDLLGPTAVLAAVLVAAAGGCGPSPTKPKDPSSTDGGNGASEPNADDIPVTPEKTPPDGLSAKEKSELGRLCAPIEPLLYDAGKAAMAALDMALLDNPNAAGAEQKALPAGLKLLAKPQEGMSQADHDRCVSLFKKQQLRRLFEFEPAEKEARDVVGTCVKRVDGVFGKENLSFDMGGSGRAGATQGPFCPDDFPVPPSLNQLPYKSSKVDWDTPTWRCLQFGLRIKQSVQVEYISARGSSEFACVARYLPRQGGAPIEIYRGGKVNEEGELLLVKKAKKRRMKVK